MIEKFKILGKYIKDLSSETPDIETYLLVKDRIAKYQLGIDINSKALKNKMVEINTTFKFEDREETKKKSYFEIIYTSIIKVDDDVKENIWSTNNSRPLSSSSSNSSSLTKFSLVSLSLIALP